MVYSPSWANKLVTSTSHRSTRYLISFFLIVGFTDSNQWSAQLIMGKVFIPISYIIGVPWNETEKVGRLIGVKTMVNEFVAFQEMQNMTLTVTKLFSLLLNEKKIVCFSLEQKL